MSTNVGPIYREAEARFRAAVTREEKLAALQEMLRVVPKHKGTEKLCADLRSRISKLKQEPKKKTGSRGASHRIPHEGAGQIALVGPPNSGGGPIPPDDAEGHAGNDAVRGRLLPIVGPPASLARARGAVGLRSDQGM